MNLHQWAVRLLFVMAEGVILVGPVLPQNPAPGSGPLEVRITNNQKAVENAQVLLTHSVTRKSYKITTDKDGRGFQANFSFGDYEVEIRSATGETLYKDKRKVTGDGAHPAVVSIDMSKDLVDLLFSPEMNHLSQGSELQKEGDLEGAIREFEEAVRLKPDDAEAHYLLAYALQENKDLKGAIREFGEALRLKPNVSKYYLFRGECYAETSQFDKAIADFNKVLELDPGNLDAIIFRADAYYFLPDYPKAVAEYSRILKAASQEPMVQLRQVVIYLRRGMSYESLGNYPAAIGDYQKTIELNPKSLVGYNNLAWVLATAPLDSARNGSKAVEYGQRAVDLAGNHESYLYMDTLAAAFAEAGRFDDAAALEQKAISLLPQDFGQKDRAGFEERLMLYKQQKPYREPVKK